MAWGGTENYNEVATSVKTWEIQERVFTMLRKVFKKCWVSSFMDQNSENNEENEHGKRCSYSKIPSKSTSKNTKSMSRILTRSSSL